jgi:hypothetical protein
MSPRVHYRLISMRGRNSSMLRKSSGAEARVPHSHEGRIFARDTGKDPRNVMY